LGGLEFGEGDAGVGQERGAEGDAGEIDGIGNGVGGDASDLGAGLIERVGILGGEGEREEEQGEAHWGVSGRR
jgi:hypothetical protein